MIVVKVELWSAISGEHSELARMVIANEGISPNPRRGNYIAYALRGRDHETLEQNTSSRGLETATHKGEVKDHARLQEHVWNLVGKCIAACGYKTA